MPTKLAAKEEEQLLATVEMFETIMESQPWDYQSLQILEQAYLKLGRSEDALSTAKKIAEAFIQLGRASDAIAEYERILRNFPGDPEAQGSLAVLQSRPAPPA